MNKIVVILGPTATGKTELALKLCQKFNGEVVSIDSRQAYEGMEIGTGRKLQAPNYKSQTNPKSQFPTTSGAKIHLYDLVEPDQQSNTYDYSLKAWEKIEDIWSRKKIPFLVGGTGFYLDVVLGRRRLSGSRADPQLRLELESLTREDLVERLRHLQPGKLETIDAKNKYRLIRAIEIAVPQGHPLPFDDAQGKSARGDLREGNFEYRLLGLTAENSYLYRRANERIERMVKAGLIEEVKKLMEKYGWAAPGLKTLGYREFRSYFDGALQLNEVIQQLKYNTHAYIRRQKTYFKKYFADAHWFNISVRGFDREVRKEVESFLAR